MTPETETESLTRGRDASVRNYAQSDSEAFFARGKRDATLSGVPFDMIETREELKSSKKIRDSAYTPHLPNDTELFLSLTPEETPA